MVSKTIKSCQIPIPYRYQNMRILVIAIRMVHKNYSIRPTLNTVHGKYVTLNGSHLPHHASYWGSSWDTRQKITYWIWCVTLTQTKLINAMKETFRSRNAQQSVMACVTSLTAVLAQETPWSGENLMQRLPHWCYSSVTQGCILLNHETCSSTCEMKEQLCSCTNMSTVSQDDMTTIPWKVTFLACFHIFRNLGETYIVDLALPLRVALWHAMCVMFEVLQDFFWKHWTWIWRHVVFRDWFSVTLGQASGDQRTSWRQSNHCKRIQNSWNTTKYINMWSDYIFFCVTLWNHTDKTYMISMTCLRNPNLHNMLV